MALFTVDADGLPLGIAATPTAIAAIDLVRVLCRAQELAMIGEERAVQRRFALSARPSSEAEEGLFQKSAMSGGVRLAGILIAADPAGVDFPPPE
jgi:hypothetical protein